MSSANLQVSLLAPECTLKMSFTGQWLSISGLPLLILGILSVVAIFSRLKWCLTRRDRDPPSTTSVNQRANQVYARDLMSCAPPPLPSEFVSTLACFLGSLPSFTRLLRLCAWVCVPLSFVALGRLTTPVSRGPPDLSYLQGLAFTCMYLLYIQVTRNSLSVFDCTTTNNPMGVRTLDGNPGIQCSLHDPVWKQVWAWV